MLVGFGRFLVRRVREHVIGICPVGCSVNIGRHGVANTEYQFNIYGILVTFQKWHLAPLRPDGLDSAL